MTLNLNAIVDEWRLMGSLSPQAIAALREHLGGDDRFEAITVAGDCYARELTPVLAEALTSEDPMIRWNAAGVLFTRWREPGMARACVDMATADPNGMVRAIALCGIGELLPGMKRLPIVAEMASLLVQTVTDTCQPLTFRGAAYEGLLAALGVPVESRPAASRLIDIGCDVEPDRIAEFVRQFVQDP